MQLLGNERMTNL